jgi:hypothetical protein
MEQPDNQVPGNKKCEEFDIGQQTVPDIKKQKESVKTFASKFDVRSDKAVCQIDRH